MDEVSQALMRSCIHDLANALSGVRGILDLADPSQPLPTRDRERLDAVVGDGLVTLERARHLALDTLPDARAELGDPWRALLQESLAPLCTIFRATVSLAYLGDTQHDHWPGELGRSYLHALVRQLLPYAQGGRLTLTFDGDAETGILTLGSVSTLPDSLIPNGTPRPRDISSRWALHAGTALAATLDFQPPVVRVTLRKF